MWIRKETHCRKNGGVTMKPWLVGWKKTRRKRRGNHGMRRALIRRRQ